MEDLELLGRLPPLLLDWYDRSARSLPWREDPTPYRVWVSEIMLQQTRVEAVKPYYRRFLKAFPTVEALAAAPEDQLLKVWEGLGYYSRARNMQKAARLLVEEHGGDFPATIEGLRALPGVGDYTAGAIGSIAFGLPEPAVDGNVLRVLSRVLCRRDNILDPKVKRRMEGELRQVLPPRVGDFNQSLMELGATVCLPGGPPRCGECPLCSLCRARAQGVSQELPVKAKAKPRRLEERTVFLLFSRQGRVALCRRPGKGLLAGLWELPGTAGSLSREEAQAFLGERGLPGAQLSPGPEGRHVFTHVEWRMASWQASALEEAPGFVWATAGQLRQDYALPSAFGAFLPQVLRTLEGLQSG